MFKVNSRRVNYILLKGTLQLFVYELFMKLFKLYTLRVHHNLYTIIYQVGYFQSTVHYYGAETHLTTVRKRTHPN